MSTPARYDEKSAPLLAVDRLSVEFSRGKSTARVIDEVSFEIRPGQRVGLVGESGSGKSVTSLAVMGLLPERRTRYSGSVSFDGTELLGLDRKRRSAMLGRDIAMIFQDPMTSLNPVITIGLQITEVLRRHFAMSRKQAAERAAELLAQVGIPDPKRRLREYPHQLSGGLRQRVMIAMALACEPRLLIADEPTTALDVTIQAQVLEVLDDLVSRTGVALLMITHDLGVVAGLCDEVNVMYSGRIVEKSSRDELFEHPRHPYTGGLLQSIPRLDSPRGVPLRPIPGSPAQTLPWSTGCAFAPRCALATEVCRSSAPLLEPIGDTSLVRCYHPLEADSADAAAPINAVSAEEER